MTRQWMALSACLIVAALAGCSATPTKPGAKRTVIEVTTVQELVAAIGPDRTIRLAPGEYVLSDIKDRYLPYIRWYPEYDGNSLTIRNVSGLSIEGSDPDASRTRLVVRPKYVFVLAFEKCDDVELRNLTLGHAPEKGQCASGVIGAKHCKDLRITNCDLFGCGTEGLTLRNVHGLLMLDSIIRDCSYGIMNLESCTDAVFTQSRFTGNEEFHGIVVADCQEVLFHSCVIEKNKMKEPLFQVVSSSGVRFLGGAIRGNRMTKLREDEESVTIEKAVVENNTLVEP